MPRSLLSLAGLIIFLIIVIGVGVLIYRFIVSDNAQVKIVLINSEGKFGTGEYTLANDEVFRVQNNSDKNQTVKKSSDKTTLVEVDANSSSRELSLSDNTESELFLAGDESQKTKVKVGSPPKEEESEAVPEAREPGTTAGTSTENQNLPNTGPENNLIFVGFALVGALLYRFSLKILN